MVTISELKVQLETLEKQNEFVSIIANDKLVFYKYFCGKICLENQTKKRQHTLNVSKTQSDSSHLSDEKLSWLPPNKAQKIMEGNWVKSINIFETNDSSFTSIWKRRISIVNHYISKAKSPQKDAPSPNKTTTKNLAHIKNKPSLPQLSDCPPAEWSKSLGRFLIDLSEKRTLFLERESVVAKNQTFEQLIKIAMACEDSQDFEVINTRTTAVSTLVGYSISSGSLRLVLRVCALLLGAEKFKGPIDREFPKTTPFLGLLERYQDNLSLSFPLETAVGAPKKSPCSRGVKTINNRDFYKSISNLSGETERESTLVVRKSVTTDGKFVYVFEGGKGLKKIGSGKSGTLVSSLYLSRSDIFKHNMAEIACIEDKLYLLDLCDHREIKICNCDNLAFIENVKLGFNTEFETPPNVVKFFTDGIYLYVLAVELTESNKKLNEVDKIEEGICEKRLDVARRFISEEKNSKIKRKFHRFSAHKQEPNEKRFLQTISKVSPSFEKFGKKINKNEIEIENSKTEKKAILESNEVFYKKSYIVYIYDPNNSEYEDKIKTDQEIEKNSFRNKRHETEFKKRKNLSKILMEATGGIYTEKECLYALLRCENSLNEATKMLSYLRKKSKRLKKLGLVRKIELETDSKNGFPESSVNFEELKKWSLYSTGHQIIFTSTFYNLSRAFDAFSGKFLGSGTNISNEDSEYCYNIKKDSICKVEFGKHLNVKMLSNIGPLFNKKDFLDSDLELKLKNRKNHQKDKRDKNHQKDKTSPINSFVKNTSEFYLKILQKEEIGNDLKLVLFLFAHIDRLFKLYRTKSLWEKASDNMAEDFKTKRDLKSLRILQSKKSGKGPLKAPKSLPGDVEHLEDEVLVSNLCPGAPLVPFCLEVEAGTIGLLYKILKISLGRRDCDDGYNYIAKTCLTLLEEHFNVLEKHSTLDEKKNLFFKVTKMKKIEYLLKDIIFKDEEKSKNCDSLQNCAVRAYCAGAFVFNQTDEKMFSFIYTLTSRLSTSSPELSEHNKKQIRIIKEVLHWFKNKENFTEIMFSKILKKEKNKFYCNLIKIHRIETKVNRKRNQTDKKTSVLKFFSSLVNKIIMLFGKLKKDSSLNSLKMLERTKENTLILAEFIFCICSEVPLLNFISNVEEFKDFDAFYNNSFLLLVPVISSLIATQFFVADPFSLLRLTPSLQTMKKILNLVSKNEMGGVVKKFNREFLEKITFENKQRYIFETSHPYLNASTNIIQSFNIKNADAIIVHFDPRCCTASSSDLLNIYKDTKMKEFAFDHFTGERANYYGIKNKLSRLPTDKPLLFSGSSLTFCFSTRSNSNKSEEKTRWGIKCFMRGINVFSLPFFFDISATVTCLSKTLAFALISGKEPISDEVFLKPWLKSLLCSGLSPTLPDKIKEKLYRYILQGEGFEFVSKLYDTVTLSGFFNLGKNRFAKEPKWMQSQRALTLALMKHSGILRSVLRVDSYLDKDLDERKIQKYLLNRMRKCVEEAKNLQIWMVEKAQILNTWNNLWHCEEVNNETEAAALKLFREEYEETAHREDLESLCQLKGVQYNKGNIRETVEHLFSVYKKEKTGEILGGQKQIAEHVLKTSLLLLEFRSFKEENQKKNKRVKNTVTSENLSTNVSRIHSEFSFESKFFEKMRRETMAGSKIIPILKRSLSMPYNSMKSNFFERREHVSRLLAYLFKTGSLKETQLIEAKNVNSYTMTIDLLTSLIRANVSSERITNVAKLQIGRCILREEGVKFLRFILENSEDDFLRAHLLGNLGDCFSSGRVRGEKSLLLNIDSCNQKNISSLLSSFDSLMEQYIKIISNSDNVNKILAFKDIFSVSFRLESVDNAQNEKIHSVISLLLNNEDEDLIENVKMDKREEKMYLKNFISFAKFLPANIKEIKFQKKLDIDNSEVIDFLNFKGELFKSPLIYEYIHSNMMTSHAKEIKVVDTENKFVSNFKRIYNEFKWSLLRLYSLNVLRHTDDMMDTINPNLIEQENKLKNTQNQIIKHFFQTLKTEITTVLKMFETNQSENPPNPTFFIDINKTKRFEKLIYGGNCKEGEIIKIVKKGQKDQNGKDGENVKNVKTEKGIYMNWMDSQNVIMKILPFVLTVLKDNEENQKSLLCAGKEMLNHYGAIVLLILVEYNKFQPVVIQIAIKILKILWKSIDEQKMIQKLNEIRMENGLSKSKNKFKSIASFVFNEIAKMLSWGVENSHRSTNFEKKNIGSTYLHSALKSQKRTLKDLKNLKNRKKESVLGSKDKERSSNRIANSKEKQCEFEKKMSLRIMAPYSVLVYGSCDEKDFENLFSLLKGPNFDEIKSYLQRLERKEQFSSENNEAFLERRKAMRRGEEKFMFRPRKEYKCKVLDERGGVSVQSEKDFVSVFGNVGVTGGKWYYEVVLETGGLMQIGWANKDFMPKNAESGCGDDSHSWAYDGSRKKIWHKTGQRDSIAYGDKNWKKGDIVGVAIDIDKREGTFYLNGKSMGVAFDNLEVKDGVFPAASFAYKQRAVFFFRPEKFKLPPPSGYYPLEGDTSFGQMKDQLFRFQASITFQNLKNQGFACIYQGDYEKCLSISRNMKENCAGSVMVVKSRDYFRGDHEERFINCGESISLIKSDFADFLEFLSLNDANNMERISELVLEPILLSNPDEIKKHKYNIEKLKTLLCALKLIFGKCQIIRAGCNVKTNFSGQSSKGIVLETQMQSPCATIYVSQRDDKTNEGELQNGNDFLSPKLHLHSTLQHGNGHLKKKAVRFAELKLETHKGIKILMGRNKNKAKLCVRKLKALAEMDFEKFEKFEYCELESVSSRFYGGDEWVEQVERIKEKERKLEGALSECGMEADEKDRIKIINSIVFVLSVELSRFDFQNFSSGVEIKNVIENATNHLFWRLRNASLFDKFKKVKTPMMQKAKEEVLLGCEEGSKIYFEKFFNAFEIFVSIHLETALDKIKIPIETGNVAGKPRNDLTIQYQNSAATLSKSIRNSAALAMNSLMRTKNFEIEPGTFISFLSQHLGDSQGVEDKISAEEVGFKLNRMEERLFDLRNKVEKIVLPLKSLKGAGNKENDLEKEKQKEIRNSFKKGVFLYSQSSYEKSGEVKSKPNRILKYWEKHIIPKIKNYVRGSFRDYEMECYFEQLRQPLRLMQTAKAIEIANTLTSGRIPGNIVFPESNRDWSFLMMEDIKIGQYLSVPEEKEHNRSRCEIGQVKKIDPVGEKVLLVFNHPEKNILVEKWFRPEEIKFIEEDCYYKNDFDNEHEFYGDLKGAEKRVFELEESLVRKSVRNTLVKMLRKRVFETSHITLLLKDCSNGIFEILKECIETFDLSKLGEYKNIKPEEEEILEKNLLGLFEFYLRQKGGNMESFIFNSFKTALNDASALLQKSQEINAKCAMKNKLLKETKFKVGVEGAKGFEIIFSKSSFIRRGENSIILYKNADCTRQLKSYFPRQNKDLEELLPTVVEGENCWIMCRQESIDNIEFSADVIPISEHIGIAFWVAKFILKKRKLLSLSAGKVCQKLLQILTGSSLMKRLKPSFVKSSLLNLCSTLIYKLKGKKKIEKIDGMLKEIENLHKEMEELYEEETKRHFTEYFQKLVQINVISDTLRSPENRLCKFNPKSVTETEGEEKREEEIEWPCDVCTFLNKLEHKECVSCGNSRGSTITRKLKDENVSSIEEIFLKMTAVCRLSAFLSRERISGEKSEKTRAELPDEIFFGYLEYLLKKEDENDKIHKRIFGIRNLPTSFKGREEISSEAIVAFIKEELSDSAGVNVNSLVLDYEKEHHLREKKICNADDPFSSDKKVKVFKPHSPIVQGTRNFDEKGIVFYMATSNGTTEYKNPAENSLITIKSSKLHPTSVGREGFVGESMSRCLTASNENSFVSFEFPSHQIKPTHYSIRHYMSWNTEALRSWVFEGSNDGESWDVLREHKNDDTIKRKGCVYTFTLSNVSKGYSVFRISMTGKNSNKHWYLAMCGFEIYGSLEGSLFQEKVVSQNSGRIALVEVTDNLKDKFEDVKTEFAKIVPSNYSEILSNDGETFPGGKLEVFLPEERMVDKFFIRSKLVSEWGTPTTPFVEAIFSLFDQFDDESKEGIKREINEFKKKEKKQKEKIKKENLEKEKEELFLHFKEKHDSSPEAIKKQLRSSLVEALKTKIELSESKIGEKKAKFEEKRKTDKKRKRSEMAEFYGDQKREKNEDEDRIKQKSSVPIIFYQEMGKKRTGRKMAKISLDSIFKLLSETPFASESSTVTLLKSLSSACADGETVDAMSLVAALCALAKESPKEMWEWLQKLRFDSELERGGRPDLREIRKMFELEAGTLCGKGRKLVDFYEKNSQALGKTSPLALEATFLKQWKIETIKDIGSNANVEVRSLQRMRLEFLIVKTFNKLLSEVLLLIDFKTSKESLSLAGLACACKEFIFSKVKNDFFDAVVNLTATPNFSAPNITLNRLAIAEKSSEGEAMSPHLERDTHFGAAMRQIGELEGHRLRPPKSLGTEPQIAFNVIFKDQHVVGTAGPYRQFFSEVSKEIFSEGCAAFAPVEELSGRAKTEFFVNEKSTSPGDRKMYRTLGMLIGCCLRTEAKLSLVLSKVFWKLLVGEKISLEDVASFDSALHIKLKTVLSGEVNELKEEILRELRDRFDKKKSLVEFSKNRKEMAASVVEKRLRDFSVQMDCIRSGIDKIIPIQLLSLLTGEKMQIMVCGSDKVDIKLLKRHTRYSPEIFNNNHLIDNFWEMLQSFDEEMRKKFILFAWGHERLPQNDEAFERTQTRMLISELSAADGCRDMALPKAHTCFFNLELPLYSNKEVMRRKFEYAITHTVTMNADEELEIHDDFEEEEYEEEYSESE